MLDSLLYYLAYGLGIGAIYALIALGYTLVYGILKLINFAHGEFYMVGAYAAYGLFVWVFRDRDLSPWLLLILLTFTAGIASAATAGLTEAIAYRPIRRAGRLSALLTAIGVSFFLQNLFNRVENGNPLSYTGALDAFCQTSAREAILEPLRQAFPPTAALCLRLSESIGRIKAISLAYIPIVLLLTLLLHLLVMRTRWGRAMRAVSQDADAAALVGIDIDRTIRMTFLLGGFLAGVAGTLVSVQGKVEPFMGFMPGLKAFVAAVVGGIGSIPGAVVGGFVIGLLENLVLFAGVDSGYKDIAALLVLLGVLWIRPQGLWGVMEREKV